MVSYLVSQQDGEDARTVGPSKTDEKPKKGPHDNGPCFQPSIWEVGTRLGLLGVRLFTPRLFGVWVHRSSTNFRI